MKKKIISAIKLIAALGLGVFIIYLSLKDLTADDKANIISSFKNANYFWVVLSIALGILSHLFRAIRWKMLLQPMGYNPPVKTSFLAVMVGYFANLGIPRSGEVARCSVLYAEEKIPVNKGFGTVIIERSIDMLLFFSLFFVTMGIEFKRIDGYVHTEIYPYLEDKFAFMSTDRIIGKGIIAIFLLSLLTYLLFRKRINKIPFVQKIINMFSGIWEGLKSVLKIKKPGLFIFYSLAIWFLYYLMVYVCFFSLPQTASLSMTSGLTILILGSIGIMVTPGGIGLYPVIVAQTIVLYGIGYSDGLALGWITWSAQTIMIIFAGSISLIVISLNKRKKNELQPKN